jgi:hypothetical protein
MKVRPSCERQSVEEAKSKARPQQSNVDHKRDREASGGSQWGHRCQRGEYTYASESCENVKDRARHIDKSTVRVGERSGKENGIHERQAERESKD